VVRSKKLAGRVKWTRMMRCNARSLAQQQQQSVQVQVAGESGCVCVCVGGGCVCVCGPCGGRIQSSPRPVSTYSARQSANQSDCQSLIAQCERDFCTKPSLRPPSQSQVGAVQACSTGLKSSPVEVERAQRSESDGTYYRVPPKVNQ
jgi:hypothetical protein